MQHRRVETAGSGKTMGGSGARGTRVRMPTDGEIAIYDVRSRGPFRARLDAAKHAITGEGRLRRGGKMRFSFKLRAPDEAQLEITRKKGRTGLGSTRLAMRRGTSAHGCPAHIDTTPVQGASAHVKSGDSSKQEADAGTAIGWATYGQVLESRRAGPVSRRRSEIAASPLRAHLGQRREGPMAPMAVDLRATQSGDLTGHGDGSGIAGGRVSPSPFQGSMAADSAFGGARDTPGRAAGRALPPGHQRKK